MIGNAQRPERAAIWDALTRRLRIGLSAANTVGALTVFVFLGFVVPVPAEVNDDWELLLLNLAIFVPAGPLVVVVANVLGMRLLQDAVAPSSTVRRGEIARDQGRIAQFGTRFGTGFLSAPGVCARQTA